MSESNVPKINNHDVYTNSDTVNYYNQLTGLLPCEQYAFTKYIAPNIAILDLGVGCGRTMPYLSSDGRQYVGVDYSDTMISVCRKKFPELSFHILDDANLSVFEDNKFDVVVFLFNDIDNLYLDEQRMRCLQEVNRLLKMNRIFIFSVHNARVIFVPPQLNSVNLARKVWRLLRITRNILLFVRQLCRKAFYKGAGYVIDAVHDGLLIHTSAPKFVVEELTQSNFRTLEVIGGNYPDRSNQYTSPWYYYVTQKIK